MHEGEWQTLRTDAMLSDEHNWGANKPNRGLPIFEIELRPLCVVEFNGTESYGRINSFAEEMLRGFHALEQHDDRPFRWTSTNSMLSFIAPPADYELKIDLGTLESMVNTETVEVACNGHILLPTTSDRKARMPKFVLPQHVFSEDILQRLQIRSRALDTSSWGGGERRELGLPLFGVSLTALMPV
jgi:hypothetical protein